MENMTNTHEPKPHFILFPFMAQGHMIPMVDIARLLARRGIIVTILTTPKNSKRVEKVISRAIDSGLTINILHLEFPCIEAGLPEGHENFDMLNSMDDALKFLKACAMLKQQVDNLLKEIKPSPSCLIADMMFPWCTNVALSLNIPRILFHGMSCFSLLCLHILAICNDFEGVASDNEYFVIPGLPDRIEITKAQIIGNNGMQNPSPDWVDIREQMRESEIEAFGIVVNTFDELETKYIEEYKKVKGKKVWCIGPVSLCNVDDLDKAERGNKSSIDENKLFKWLDSMEPRFVLYVCLGSLARLSASQLIELGLALEASNRPFVWVIRNVPEEFETWVLEEKFEERSKGILVRGWAPQVLILSHQSVGGFLTHCGWNSTLEGVTAGLPMMTWPVLADQFCNERFIVNVIKTGVRVGVEVPIVFEEEKFGVQVKSDEIKMVIDELMDGGVEGDERRARARRLGEAAKRAPEEGGSSYNNVTLLVQDVINLGESQS